MAFVPPAYAIDVRSRAIAMVLVRPRYGADLLRFRHQV